jgi:phosphoribosylformimino-5-aminoimidazole carboxamide ribotide isomerase
MLRLKSMLIIPAIDLRHGKCVRLEQGRKDSATAYDVDPLTIATAFESDGARMLHIVDLDGAFGEGKSLNREVAKQIIRSSSIPVQFGGGLRGVDDVEEMISANAARVVIGTVAVEFPEMLARLVKLFGARIVVGIDARDGQVMTRGWETGGRVEAVDLARRVAAAGVERIVYTDVARDGMLAGINIEQTVKIARESGLRVTASGGVSCVEDLKRLSNAAGSGIDSVIVGKALYEGRFTLKEALQETQNS